MVRQEEKRKEVERIRKRGARKSNVYIWPFESRPISANALACVHVHVYACIRVRRRLTSEGVAVRRPRPADYYLSLLHLRKSRMTSPPPLRIITARA